MAKTLAEMRTNYQAGGANAESNWNAAKGRMVQNWIDAMTKVLGHPPGPITTAKFRDKIERAKYTYGDAETFIRNFERSMSE